MYRLKANNDVIVKANRVIYARIEGFYIGSKGLQQDISGPSQPSYKNTYCLEEIAF